MCGEWLIKPTACRASERILPTIQQSNPFTKDDADANAELQGVGLCLDCIKHEG